MEVSEGHPTALIRLHHGERASTTLFAPLLTIKKKEMGGKGKKCD